MTPDTAPPPAKDVVIETLAQVNRIMREDSNALLAAPSGEAANHGATYIKLVDRLLTLLD